MPAFIILALILATLAFTPGAGAATPVSGFSDKVALSGLTNPTAVAFLPDGKWLVSQKGGKILLVDGATATTLTVIPTCTNLGFGVLGIAVDPNFSSNGFVYLNRTLA